MEGFSSRVKEWANRGHKETFQDYKIHCFYQEGSNPNSSSEDPLLVILHGYPTCSYDWVKVIDLLPSKAILTFDLLGFGLSDKPIQHNYSLTWQADLALELIKRHNQSKKRKIFLVAHDMGTSVACEIFARDIETKLLDAGEIIGALLFNGNMIMEKSSLILGQRLLRTPFLGPLAARLSFSWAFQWQLGKVFSSKYPLTPEEGEDQWDLMSYKNGHRINHKLIQYTFERVEKAERWLGAIKEWKQPSNSSLTFAWGMEDPVATSAMQLEGWKELRPQAKVHEFKGLAHYPQIEHPQTFIQVLEQIVYGIIPAE